MSNVAEFIKVNPRLKKLPIDMIQCVQGFRILRRTDTKANSIAIYSPRFLQNEKNRCVFKLESREVRLNYIISHHNTNGTNIGAP